MKNICDIEKVYNLYGKKKSQANENRFRLIFLRGKIDEKESSLPTFLSIISHYKLP